MLAGLAATTEKQIKKTWATNSPTCSPIAEKSLCYQAVSLRPRISGRLAQNYNYSLMPLQQTKKFIEQIF